MMQHIILKWWQNKHKYKTKAWHESKFEPKSISTMDTSSFSLLRAECNAADTAHHFHPYEGNLTLDIILNTDNNKSQK